MSLVLLVQLQQLWISLWLGSRAPQWSTQYEWTWTRIEHPEQQIQRKQMLLVKLTGQLLTLQLIVAFCI